MKYLVRSLLRNKTFTSINIIGLSMGIACVFIIALWLRHETSYDQFHAKHERMYRITFEMNSPNGFNAHFARTPFPWVASIPDKFPEVEQIVRLGNSEKSLLKTEDKKTYGRGFGAETNFFDLFAMNIIHGDTSSMFKEVRSIAISSTLKKTLFGEQNPIGETIKIKSRYYTEAEPYKVTGVFEDLPQNTHLAFDYLTTFTDIRYYGNWAYYYLLLEQDADPDELKEKIYAMLEADNPEYDRSMHVIYLQPVADIHLNSDKQREMKPNGDGQQVQIFIFVAILIILISLVNFFNLNTAILDKRFHTHMLRRILGARKRDILIDIGMEALFIGVLAILIAWISIEQLIPFAKQFAFFDMPALDWDSYFFLLKIAGLVLLFILGASILPLFTFKRFSSFIFNRLEYSATLPHNMFVRRLLVGLQFGISIVLIISVLIVRQQTYYSLGKSMADEQSNAICLDFNNYEVMQQYERYKAELEKHSVIEDVTAIMECPPREIKDVKGFDCKAVEEDKQSTLLYVLPTDDNFVEFFDLELLAGEGFPEYKPALQREDYVLNEKAAKLLGWENPEEALGHDFRLLYPEMDTIFKGGKIVGVVEDFHFSSLHKEIQPLVMFQKPLWYFAILIKYNPLNEEEALAISRKVWSELFVDYPFEYSFLEDEYEGAYKKELSTLKLLSVFVTLILIVSALGLFALTAIIAERKTKEIAIRKVNGAGVWSILKLFSLSFQKIVLVAFVVAAPVSFYLTKVWLGNFIYQSEIGWWFYAVGLIVAILVVQLTITWQCLKVARRNPVLSLRAE